jgi:hypothetical protein
MIQSIKKYFIIRSYMKRLSLELARRFNKRPFYTIEHVSHAIQRAKLSAEYLAYAHAAFCNEHDFVIHYQRLGKCFDYQDLRRFIARRYFSGDVNFDAEMIINKYRRAVYDSDSFHESGLGGGHDGPY